jgi:MraZ protein
VFFGSYEHTVDEKGRLAVPVRFRNELGSNAYLTRSLDKCLALYTSAAFEKLAEEYEALPTSDENARNLQRNFFSGVTPVEFDKQGRISIPPELREHAELEGEAVTAMVVGVKSRVEIWNKEVWLKVQEETREKAPAMAAALGNLRLV